MLRRNVCRTSLKITFQSLPEMPHNLKIPHVRIKITALSWHSRSMWKGFGRRDENHFLYDRLFFCKQLRLEKTITTEAECGTELEGWPDIVDPGPLDCVGQKGRSMLGCVDVDVNICFDCFWFRLAGPVRGFRCKISQTELKFDQENMQSNSVLEGP